MLYEIQVGVYRGLRRSAGLSQRQLAAAIGCGRSTIQRIEKGRRPLTREEEDAIREATESSRTFFAELVCKTLSEILGVRVSIDAQDAEGYRAETPEAEANQLLREARGKLPEDRLWAWRQRLGRLKTLGLMVEQESYGAVRELRRELRALAEIEEPPEEEPGMDTTA